MVSTTVFHPILSHIPFPAYFSLVASRRCKFDVSRPPNPAGKERKTKTGSDTMADRNHTGPHPSR